MSHVKRVAIVDPQDSTRTILKNLLLSLDSLWLEADCSRYEFFIDVLSQASPDIAIISLDSDPIKGLALIQQVSRQLPTCAVLALSGSQEGSLILQAMRNGAKEFLNSPLTQEDILAALDRVSSAPSGTTTGTLDTKVRTSQVLTVTGVEGGVGCTALAVNLACQLARNKANSVCIVDLDLALGDADVWLDLIPDYTIQDVAENISRLDYTLLNRSLKKHACGASLLPRPMQMYDQPIMNSETLRRIISLLRATFTHLVIDVGKSYSPLELAAMQSSDTILLISHLDLPGLRNIVRLNQFFDELEGVNEKVRVILNRIGIDDASISVAKARETIGRDIFYEIPNEYQVMVESRNQGVPLMTHAPKAKVTKALEAIAQFFDEEHSDEDTPKKQKKGLFSFLSS